MKTPLFLIPLAAIAITGSPTVAQEAEPSAEIFYCDTSEDTPITFVRKRGDTDKAEESYPLLRWSEPYFNSEEARSMCQEVSQRLRSIAKIRLEQGKSRTFVFVSEKAETKVTFCLEREQDTGCEQGDFLFAIETSQEPEKVLSEVIHPDFLSNIETTQRGDFKTARMPSFGLGWLF